MGIFLQKDPWSSAVRDALPGLIPLGLLGVLSLHFVVWVLARLHRVNSWPHCMCCVLRCNSRSASLRYTVLLKFNDIARTCWYIAVPAPLGRACVTGAREVHISSGHTIKQTQI